MEKEKETFSRIDLENMVKKVLGVENLTPLIKKQIANMRLDLNMTYKEIGRCLIYYVEVLGKEFDNWELYGIGLIKNLREQANKYFEQLKLDQLKRQEEAKKLVKYQDNNIIFNIKDLQNLKKKRQPKQIDMSKIGTGGDADDGHERSH